jgi:hypothetical protein
MALANDKVEYRGRRDSEASLIGHDEILSVLLERLADDALSGAV